MSVFAKRPSVVSLLENQSFRHLHIVLEQQDKARNRVTTSICSCRWALIKYWIVIAYAETTLILLYRYRLSDLYFVIEFIRNTCLFILF